MALFKSAYFVRKRKYEKRRVLHYYVILGSQKESKGKVRQIEAGIALVAWFLSAGVRNKNRVKPVW